MAQLFALCLVAVVLSADSSSAPDHNTGISSSNAEPIAIPENFKGWNPYNAFQKAFKDAGYSEADLVKINARFWKDTMDTSRWPFTDPATDMYRSANNAANDNAGSVAEAITEAGGDPSNIQSLTGDIQHKVATIISKQNNNSESSLLQRSQTVPEGYLGQLLGHSAANSATIDLLSRSMVMTSGSVATNTAAIAGLSTTVAVNTAAIAGVGGAVASMTAVTAPTVALAATLGVEISTIASLSLAGSFAGPMLGVMALVYVAWPEEETDPWFKMESKVVQMISNKFDAKRRKKLGDRIRRYMKQFSRCAQAWVDSSMVKLNGISVPRWIVDESAFAKKKEPFELDIKSERSYPTPRCMTQLEGHMSLERDEWYATEDGGMSGLFMPFANMHTQLLNALADNKPDGLMQWDKALKTTSAEYASYMLDHVLHAWKSQVCRTTRLRQAKGMGMSFNYNFVVLREIHQPHAAEDCSAQCPQSGWCDFCGGKQIGACCASGSTEGDFNQGIRQGVCKQFDAPLSWTTSASYRSCVHTDCVQKNTGYYGQAVKAFTHTEEMGPMAPEECRQLCLTQNGAVAFTLNDAGMKCTCLSKEKLWLYKEDGAFAGRTVCSKSAASLLEQEEAFAEGLEERASLPMQEIEPCVEKSPSAYSFAEVEEKHPKWVQGCYKKVVREATKDFNRFYERFAKFIDGLAWKAGCGAEHAGSWERSAKSEGLDRISDSFDAGTFATCNWDLEAKLDQDVEKKWKFDNSTMARSGWFRSSKVDMEEQKQAKMQYSMPSWLHDLRNVQNCLKKTAAGLVEDWTNDQSAAVGTIMATATDN